MLLLLKSLGRVIDKLSQFYKVANANVHRGSHSLSNTATSQFELARKTVAAFINAPNVHEVIWCKGTTEAINLVANSLGSYLLNNSDQQPATILVSTSEHHANIVPWQLIAARTDSQVIAIPLTKDMQIDQAEYRRLLALHRPKIVALAHVSNALGHIHPIRQMIAKAKEYGAITLIDGAQAVGHFSVDVQQLDCDFYCFSAHKCFGPTGIGALWGKQALLNKMPPWQGGGEMIKQVSFSGTSFNQLPFKFEAGTPPIADAIAFGSAIDYLTTMDRAAAEKHEQHLFHRLYTGCTAISGVQVISSLDNNVGIVSLTVSGLHHQDIAILLDQNGIAVRSGHHCAMPLMQALGIDGTLRASISFYNTEQEVDFFVSALQEVIAVLNNDFIEDTVIIADKATPLPANPQRDRQQYPTSEVVIGNLLNASSWQQRFSYLMSLATLLERPSPQLLIDRHKLQQCESAVWLHKTVLDQQTSYQAWSEAKIMRGLLVMLISCRDQAQQDSDLFLSQVKLSQFLSPSRTNGVKAILDAL